MYSYMEGTRTRTGIWSSFCVVATELVDGHWGAITGADRGEGATL